MPRTVIIEDFKASEPCGEDEEIEEIFCETLPKLPTVPTKASGRVDTSAAASFSRAEVDRASGAVVASAPAASAPKMAASFQQQTKVEDDSAIAFGIAPVLPRHLMWLRLSRLDAQAIMQSRGLVTSLSPCRLRPRLSQMKRFSKNTKNG